MDENHQDESGKTTTAVEDAKGVLKGKRKLGMPQQSKVGWLRRGFKAKTSWDWLQLVVQLLTALALPVALFLGAQWFSSQQSQASLQIAADQQQEAILQSYLNDMSDLLLNHNLANSKLGDTVRQIARERTLTTLRRLKVDRNKIVLQFLQEAKLISGNDAVIDLSSADLSNDELSGANLSGVSLIFANLSGANLSGANLSGVSLNNADMRGANLSGAYLGDTFLLSGVTLAATNLDGANLSGASLNNANLSGASLATTNLSGANLSGANLTGADLGMALFLTQQQLDQVSSCIDTALPEGLACHRTP